MRVAALAFLALVASVASGCGGGNDEKTPTAIAVVADATPATTQVPEPTPTIAPTPTREPTGPALEILDNGLTFTNSIDTYIVVGEVLNSGDTYLEFIEVVGTFYDDAGDVVASEFTFVLQNIVAPGDTASFKLQVFDGATLGIADQQLNAQGNATLDRPVPGLSIRGDTSRVDEIGYHVVGEVINEGEEPLQLVEVISTFYGADGTVLAADSIFTELDVVPAGGTSPFELTLFDGVTMGEGVAPLITSYKLAVEG